jgi:hypothetical protein
MPSRRHSDAILSSPRSPSITIRIFIHPNDEEQVCADPPHLK